MTLLEQLCDHVRLLKAFQSISASQDPKVYAQFAHNWAAECQQLSDDLRGGLYAFAGYETWEQKVTKYYVEDGFIRSKLKNRQLVRMGLLDKIVQRSIYHLVGERLHDATSTSLRSGIRTSIFSEFARIRAFRADRFWCFETDIKAFYDNIDRQRLERVVTSLFDGDSSLQSLLESFLAVKVPSQVDDLDGSRVGVVQGSVLSPLLANVYLAEFDKQVHDRWPNSSRFMDDLVVFTESEDDANRAVEFIVEYLSRSRPTHQMMDRQRRMFARQMRPCCSWAFASRS